MRSTALALFALLLLPTVLALPPASLTPPLPSNASLLPLNAVKNGGFESGLASWSAYGYAGHPLPVVSPGAAASSKAFSSLNAYYGGGVFQAIKPTANVGADLLLDFYAKAANGPAKTGTNAIMAMSHWVPATGAGQLTVHVAFHGTQVNYLVWGGKAVSTAAPTDGQWHHYQVLLAGPLGLGLLLIDGLPAMDASGNVALATGNPASVDPANNFLLGDVTWCDCNGGPAPDVVYDEIYLGPQV